MAVVVYGFVSIGLRENAKFSFVFTNEGPKIMSSSRWPNISHGSILCMQLLLNPKPINQIMDFSIVNLQFSSDFLLLKLLIHRSCGKLLCFIFIFTFGSIENITAYIWIAVKLSSFSWLHKKSKRKKKKKLGSMNGKNARSHGKSWKFFRRLVDTL